MTAVVRVRIRVEGIVQGVGFRPFVHALAARFALAGFVGNDARGVFAEVEGDPNDVDGFVAALRSEAPPLALIEGVEMRSVEPNGGEGFVIVESPGGGERRTLISADAATCDACLGELFEPADRRFRHAFVNCTDCGPRFTIVRDVPYDRPFTTMAAFPMCADCEREYRDPSDRRYHAQPTCCPACGPTLRLVDGDRRVIDEDALAGTVRLLEAGAVVAIKGLGGYHLSADARSQAAVAALRARKHREDKPFAVMAPDLEAVGALCEVSREEERVLTGAGRPIVLLDRRVEPSATVAQAVAPGRRCLGLMLPYTPLHHLLLHDLGHPIVLTSGNVSDEPIAYRDEDAFARLAGIAEAFLTHDRAIHIRTDDSVLRVVAGRERPLRRSRGYVPQPMRLPWPFPRPVLACGAALKNTFCVAKGRHAFVSHHIGDLENDETLRSFTEGIEHFRRLFDIRPEVVAHDLHPEYLSTKFAMDLDGVERLGVQHHHAHIASCLADNGVPGPVIGVAFDGTGFGTDGTIWGGEFLLADLAGFERVGHLAPVPLPGGDGAVREPWRMAASYLDAAYGDDLPSSLEVVARNQGRWRDVVALSRSGLGSPFTSSAGRLFDAVGAIVVGRDTITFEGQAAIDLEQLASPGHHGAYPASIEAGGTFRILGIDLIRAVSEDLRAGVEPGIVAARFHAGMAAAIVAGCERARDATGLSAAALSGGVFQNRILERQVVAALEVIGFDVLVHHRVPPNDGGISLGQAAVAGARDRAS